jgi:hypothetical protein
MELLLFIKKKLVDFFHKSNGGKIDKVTMTRKFLDILDLRLLNDSNDVGINLMDSDLDIYPSNKEYKIIKSILDDLTNVEP